MPLDSSSLCCAWSPSSSGRLKLDSSHGSLRGFGSDHRHNRNEAPCVTQSRPRGVPSILRGDSLGVSLEKAESNTRSVVSSEPHQDCTGSVVHNSLPQTFGSFAQWRMAQTDKGMCRSMPNPNMTVA
jgi:hypothetical protein